MSQHKGTVIVTGVSSGIGWELCKLFARDRYPLLISARNEDRLQALAEELRTNGAPVTIYPADLDDPDSPRRLFEAAERASPPVEILVNNAGFGLYGPFAAADLNATLAMIQVNVTALTHLTRLILPGMLARQRGRIMNVASTAAFQPGPLLAVYYATKAYVLHFSEALANEVSGSGVTVTALCPGPTETAFKSRAGMGDTWLFGKRRLMSASRVAAAGYRALMRGRRLVIPGIRNKLLVQGNRLAPRRIVTAIVRRLQESRGDQRSAES